jgi:hypothetical protein
MEATYFIVDCGRNLSRRDDGLDRRGRIFGKITQFTGGSVELFAEHLGARQRSKGRRGKSADLQN